MVVADSALSGGAAEPPMALQKRFQQMWLHIGGRTYMACCVVSASVLWGDVCTDESTQLARHP